MLLCHISNIPRHSSCSLSPRLTIFSDHLLFPYLYIFSSCSRAPHEFVPTRRHLGRKIRKRSIYLFLASSSRCHARRSGFLETTLLFFLLHRPATKVSSQCCPAAGQCTHITCSQLARSEVTVLCCITCDFAACGSVRFPPYMRCLSC